MTGAAGADRGAGGPQPDPPGAAEGMKFYLLPSVDSIRENGLGSLITDAMNQAFFTLILGIAAMEIFGSYMRTGQTLPARPSASACWTPSWR